MKFFKFRGKGATQGHIPSKEELAADHRAYAGRVLRAFGYSDDIADNSVYQEIVLSHTPTRKGQACVLRGQRIGDAHGRYLSDFIIDGPLSDSTVEDFLV